MRHEEARRLIRQQFEEGVLASLPAQALRAHLRGCEACRREYDRTVEIERALDGSKAQADRVVAAGPPIPAARPRVVWIVPILAVAAALVFLLRPVFFPESAEFQARGGDAPAGKRAWVALYAKRGDTVRPADGHLAAGEGLLVAWSTLKESPSRFLAVAARDAAGAVRWVHPAFEAGTSPRSVPVESGVADREVPEVVYLEGLAGPVEVCAMFTEKALEIPRLDADLEGGMPWPAGADCHRLELR